MLKNLRYEYLQGDNFVFHQIYFNNNFTGICDVT